MPETTGVSRRIACFISPHGMGHAARSAAVMAALQRREAGIGLEIFAKAASRFFEESGCRHLTVHNESVDIGFVQKDALVEDIPETVRRLDGFLPFAEDLIGRLAAAVRGAGCTAILCDIAPLGIAVARRVGIPSVLMENFTWDNLYDLCAAGHPRLRDHAATLRRWFGLADVHIQTEPVCDPAAGAALTVRPVSRPPRTEPAQVRRQLGIARGQKLVFVSISGMTERMPMFAHLAGRDDLVFVAACSAPGVRRLGNVIALPLHSEFYHPDLVNAADLVIGKVGYSTLAEVYRAGVPFGYLCREQSPEMPALIRFVEQHVAGRLLRMADLGGANTGARIDELLAMPRRPPLLANGAVEIAEFLLRYGL